MKKKIFQKAVLNGLHSIESAVIDFQKNNDSEALHQLRVQIKKLRAIRSFLEFTQEEQLDLSTLKPLFKQAGSLRELYLNMVWLEEGIIFPAARLKKMRQMEEKQKEIFLSKTQKYITNVKKISDSITLTGTLPSKEKIKSYFRNKLNELLWLERIEDRDEMHRFRKTIKEILYVLELLPDKVQHYLDLDQTFFDKVQRKAGVWHDAYVGLQFVSSHVPPDGMKSLIEQMTKREQKYFSALLKYRNKINKILIN